MRQVTVMPEEAASFAAGLFPASGTAQDADTRQSFQRHTVLRDMISQEMASIAVSSAQSSSGFYFGFFAHAEQPIFRDRS